MAPVHHGGGWNPDPAQAKARTNRRNGGAIYLLRKVLASYGVGGRSSRTVVGGARVVSGAEKKAFDRGGPIWPPRSNAADDRLGGWWSGGALPQTPPLKRSFVTFDRGGQTGPPRSNDFCFGAVDDKGAVDDTGTADDMGAKKK